MAKKYIGTSVLDAAQERVKIIFDHFPRVYLSFSGGKDSAVSFHLMAQEARKQNKKFGVFIVDLEAQYQYTIDHIGEMIEMYSDVTDVYWCCLPLALRNAVSVFEPKWICWDESKRDLWVREMPDMAINNETKDFPFEHGMEFEDFVVDFAKWYSQGEPTACVVGIRTDESLNRYRSITNKRKKTFADNHWTTKIYDSTVYNCYPIYDWKTSDIWTYNNKFDCAYNKLYDIMYKAGLTIHQQRICQPYGDDQRKGLCLFQVIEPETWAKVVARVAGVNSGAEFVQLRGNASGNYKVTKPDEHTWESFCGVILETMPNAMAEHYKNKIHVFLRWYEKRGYSSGIPDFADLKEENSRSVPSWRRIAKMLLRNDYWAKGIGFSQTKSGYFYENYMRRIKKEREA